MTKFKLGRLPNDPTKKRLKLTPHLKAVSPAPRVDWISNVSNWPMYGNDKIGDCTTAAVGHMIEVVTTYGQGKTVEVSDADVLTAYEAVSGYDPRTGANDNGAVMQDVLNYWRKTGVGKHKIVAFAEIDRTNIAACQYVTELFGNAYLGINFPNTAFGQLDSGKPWDVVSGAKVIGGHAIPAPWYDSTEWEGKGGWKVITWGQVQEMTQAFWDKYVEEVWVAIDDDWIKNNQSPEGLDLTSLGDAFTELTGQPSPFHPVDPPPPPAPDPITVDSADKALATPAHTYLTNHNNSHPFPLALKKWLDAKGL